MLSNIKNVNDQDSAKKKEKKSGLFCQNNFQHHIAPSQNVCKNSLEKFKLVKRFSVEKNQLLNGD
ncbi:hypothetical protein DERP_002733 [Dermatophagoides pteronyssinus]|uniref:Uncharacterized protein n=1 Tax=Dermatophagoides pteronyssinus TaxID=6956 RepID=A0ABQ8JVH8_DERPT|nr:hypothetical protein DERP_002733 [Dermatophagoides pteronyssinus]